MGGKIVDMRFAGAFALLSGVLLSPLVWPQGTGVIPIRKGNLSPQEEQAQEMFQLPFACGGIWWAYTYSNHDPSELALDINAKAPGTNQPPGLDTPVLASSRGIVTTAAQTGYNGGYGTFVKIDHCNGWTTLYAHLIENSITVSVNEPVEPGQQIGRLGQTGNADGPHLHYEQILNGDPQAIVFNGQPVTYEYFPNKASIESHNCPCGGGSSEGFRVSGGPPVHPDGTLVQRRGSSAVYLLQNRQLREISSPRVLYCLYENGGFDFGDVILVDADELVGYSIGPDVLDTLPGNGRARPDGRLIRRLGTLDFSIVTNNGGRRPFNSEESLLGLGYLFCNVVGVGDYDSYQPVGSIVSEPEFCSFSLSTLGAFFLSLGGTGDIQIDTQSNCLWSAESLVSWVRVFLGSSSATQSSTGAGTLTYEVDPNSGGVSRMGAIRVAGQSFTISQDSQGDPGDTSSLSVTDGLRLLDSPPYAVGGSATVEATVENTGGSTITLDRIQAVGGFADEYSVYQRSWPAVEFFPPLTLQPGQSIHYTERNDSDPFPSGTLTTGTVMLFVKFNSIGGQYPVIQATAGDSPSIVVPVTEHPLNIQIGPTGEPNPVASEAAANLTSYAVDSLGHSLSYSWWASCSGLGSSGLFNNANAINPVWTAPLNSTGSQQDCLIGLVVHDDHGVSRTRQYIQSVSPEAPAGCTPPASGDWVISENCVLEASVTAPGDIVVNPSVTLTIGSGVILDIDFANHRLRLLPGSKVVNEGGTIR